MVAMDKIIVTTIQGELFKWLFYSWQQIKQHMLPISKLFVGATFDFASHCIVLNLKLLQQSILTEISLLFVVKINVVC